MNYTTKDSGNRKEFETGFKRDIPADKPRFDLTIPKDIPYERQMSTRFAKLMHRGAVKYGERNWEKSNTDEELTSFKSSAFRHFMRWFTDEIDEDHAAAVFFNIQAAERIKYLRSSANE